MILDVMPDYPTSFMDDGGIVIYVVASIIIAALVIITVKYINKKKGE